MERFLQTKSKSTNEIIKSTNEIIKKYKRNHKKYKRNLNGITFSCGGLLRVSWCI
jgi:hypothetical protein